MGTQRTTNRKWRWGSPACSFLFQGARRKMQLLDRQRRVEAKGGFYPTSLKSSSSPDHITRALNLLLRPHLWKQAGEHSCKDRREVIMFLVSNIGFSRIIWECVQLSPQIRLALSALKIWIPCILARRWDFLRKGVVVWKHEVPFDLPSVITASSLLQFPPESRRLKLTRNIPESLTMK